MKLAHLPISLICAALLFNPTLGFSEGGFFSRVFGSSQKSVDTTTDLLETFKASCPVEVSDWVGDALSHARSLKQIALQAEKDPNCGYLTSLIGNLDVLETRMAELTQDPYIVEISGLEKEQTELTLLMQNPAQASALSELSASLRLNQLKLANLRGSQISSREYEKDIKRSQAVKSLVSSSQSILLSLATSVSDTKCLPSQKRNILGAAFSMAASVAAALNTGASRVAIEGGVQLINQVMHYLSAAKIQNLIQDINKAEIALTYRCVVGTFSNHRCRARDTIDLIKLKEDGIKAMQSNKKKEPMAEAYQALNIDLPVLENWISKVSAGSDPANIFDAERKMAAQEQENYVRSTVTKTKGYFNKMVSEIQKIRLDVRDGADQKSKTWREIRQFLILARNQFVNRDQFGNQRESIFTKIYDTEYLPFLLLNYEKRFWLDSIYHGNSNNKGGPRSIDSYDPIDGTATDGHGIPDEHKPFDPIKMVKVIDLQLKKLMITAQEAVLREKSTTSNTNPINILQSAASPYESNQSRSPYDAMVGLIQFLKKIQLEPSSALDPNKKSKQDTLLRLEWIEKHLRLYLFDSSTLADSIEAEAKGTRSSPGNLDNQSNPGADPLVDEAAKLVLEISRVAKIQDAVDYMSQNLKTIIRFRINEIIREKKSYLSGNLMQKFLAASDALTELGDSFALGQSSGTAELRDRILISMDITDETFKSFVRIFGPALNKSLATQRREALSDTKKWTSEKGIALSKMCGYLLSQKTLPRELDLAQCLGSKMVSTWDKSLDSNAITSGFFNAPVESRQCIVEDFYRRDRIRAKQY